MDGKTLLRGLRELLQETTSGTFLNDRTSYEYLYRAACDLASRTRAFTSTQSITTVASQTDYNLNYDFLDISLTDDQNEKKIKYYDGSGTYFIDWRDYNGIVLSNNSTDVPIPSNFTIVSASQGTNITGTASAAGTSSNGECTLTDTSSTTKFSNANVGDLVHNITDTSDGVIVAKTSDTALVTALFEGTNNDWTSADSYVVVPRTKYALKLDPPPSTASHTITVYYVQKPFPVFSSYRQYNFPNEYETPLISFAAFLYKYRDLDPNFGDALYRVYDIATKRAARASNMSLNKSGFKVNFIKRSGTSRGYR